MPQLHELLAVEKPLDQELSTATNKFKSVCNHPSLFLGHLKILTDLVADHQGEVKSEVSSKVDVGVTIKETLDPFINEWSKVTDLNYQKEVTNQNASADLILNGVVIAKSVPVLALVNMEKQVKLLISSLEALPVLPMDKVWVNDPSLPEGVLRSKDNDKTYKEVKQTRHIVTVQPTDRHPAQTAEVIENVRVGIYETTHYSSSMDAKTKQAMLQRAKALHLAIVTARQRANTAAAEISKISEVLTNFVLNADLSKAVSQ